VCVRGHSERTSGTMLKGMVSLTLLLGGSAAAYAVAEGPAPGAAAGCMGICLGDVTAMAAEQNSALLWTGTKGAGAYTRPVFSST
jgi:hypothetical protein